MQRTESKKTHSEAWGAAREARGREKGGWERRKEGEQEMAPRAFGRTD